MDPGTCSTTFWWLLASYLGEDYEVGVSSQGICVKYLGSQRRKELWVEVQDATKKKKKKARKRGNTQKRKGLWVGGREGWGR